MSDDLDSVCGMVGTPPWLTEDQFHRVCEFHGFGPHDDGMAEAKAACWNPQRRAYSAAKLNRELGY